MFQVPWQISRRILFQVHVPQRISRRILFQVPWRFRVPRQIYRRILFQVPWGILLCRQRISHWILFRIPRQRSCRILFQVQRWIVFWPISIPQRIPHRILFQVPQKIFLCCQNRGRYSNPNPHHHKWNQRKPFVMGTSSYLISTIWWTWTSYQWNKAYTSLNL